MEPYPSNNMNQPNLDIALDALDKGIVPIPCHPLSKVPMVKWKRYQTEPPSRELVRRWFADSQVNIAVICTDAVVFDVDDPALIGFVLHECGDTPEKVRTPKGGIHLPYRVPKGVEVGN